MVQQKRHQRGSRAFVNERGKDSCVQGSSGYWFSFVYAFSCKKEKKKKTLQILIIQKPITLIMILRMFLLCDAVHFYCDCTTYSSVAFAKLMQMHLQNENLTWHRTWTVSHNHSVSSNVEFPAVSCFATFCKQEAEQLSIMIYYLKCLPGSASIRHNQWTCLTSKSQMCCHILMMYEISTL